MGLIDRAVIDEGRAHAMRRDYSTAAMIKTPDAVHRAPTPIIRWDVYIRQGKIIVVGTPFMASVDEGRRIIFEKPAENRTR